MGTFAYRLGELSDFFGEPGDGAGHSSGPVAPPEGRVDQALEIVEVHAGAD